MSCYLYYYLRKKDLPENEDGIWLTEFPTSLARELDKEIGYEYEKRTVLDDDLANATSEFYEKRINELKTVLAKCEERARDLRALYVQAQSECVLNDIKDEMSANEELKEYELEQLEDYSWYQGRFDVVCDILATTAPTGELNDYEIVYYIG